MAHTFIPNMQTFRFIQRKRYPISSMDMTTMFSGLYVDFKHLTNDADLCYTDIDSGVTSRLVCQTAAMENIRFVGNLTKIYMRTI
jgi:hypothetical protein